MQKHNSDFFACALDAVTVSFKPLQHPHNNQTEPHVNYQQLISKTQAHGNWLFDRDLEALDNADRASKACREQIERAVTFDDLMELLVELDQGQREQFMSALARGEADDIRVIYDLLYGAKEAIVKRRLAGGE